MVEERSQGRGQSVYTTMVKKKWRGAGWGGAGLESHGIVKA